MNILTFDIEEWALAKAGGYGTPERYAEYEALLSKILDLLEDRHISATFFCTGLMASSFPDVVKKIHIRGHEIGCHSYHHTRMDKLQYSEAKEDTRIAVDELEQCIGEKILCYRAPAFSICKTNKWMFEILAECGIQYDASIFPVLRDFGGFPDFVESHPCYIDYQGIRMKEFPVNTVSIFGKKIVISGGGYFRITPQFFIKRQIARSNYSICYFHINDFLQEISALKTKEEYEAVLKESGTLINRYKRFIKANIGKKSAWSKLENVVKITPFTSVLSSDKMIDWLKSPVVYL